MVGTGLSDRTDNHVLSALAVVTEDTTMSPTEPSRRNILQAIGSAGALAAMAAGCGTNRSTSPPGAVPVPNARATTPSSSIDSARSGTAITATTASTATTAPIPPTSANAYFPPAGRWESVTPEDAGWSSSGLEALATTVGEANSDSLVVLAGGRIVLERYWNGYGETSTRDIASCQKSVTSTLVGIAIEKGLLTLDDPVSKYVDPGWTKASPADEGAILIRHLITMTSGLHPTKLTKVAAPGTIWNYNTDAYQKTRLVLERASAEDIDTITRAWIWDTIDVSAATNWRSRPGAVDAVGSPIWGLACTARDMARFGLLVLRKGAWAGNRVVNEAWLNDATRPSQTLNPSYGYLWWLLGAGENKGRNVAPPDLVAALGAQDQKIYVCPSLDLVLARQGLAAKETSESASDFDNVLIDGLLAARLSAAGNNGG